MEEIKVYISEDKLAQDKSLIVKCIGLLQQSNTIEEFEKELNNLNHYSEFNQNRNEILIKIDSSDKSFLVPVTSRKIAK